MEEKIKKRPRHISTNIDFEFRSPIIKRILSAFMAVLLVTIAGYQIYTYVKTKKELPTETALLTTVYRSVNTQAVALRSETVLTHSATGTVVPMVDNGSKVAINDVVAALYANASEAHNATAALSIRNEIAFYEDISALSAGNLVAGIKMYNGNVTNRLLDLLNAADKGDLSDFSSNVSDFTESLTKKQIAVGKQVDVSPKLKTLYAQIQALEGQSSAFTSVSAPKSGYYVNTVDGYEDLFGCSSVTTLTDVQVNSMLSEPPAASTPNVGKLITEFDWYLVCVVKTAEADTLSVGDKVNISVDELGGETLSMRVKAKNICENDSVVLVFSSNIMNSAVAGLRFSQIKIRVDEYKGYAVNKKAVRTVDNTVGVYIQLGNMIRFRKIDIIYSDGNICLAAESNEDNYLKLYDEIIVEGVDNNDGRIVE